MVPAEGRGPLGPLGTYGPYWGLKAPSSKIWQTKPIQFGLMRKFVSRQSFRHYKTKICLLVIILLTVVE